MTHKELWRRERFQPMISRAIDAAMRNDNGSVCARTRRVGRLAAECAVDALTAYWPCYTAIYVDTQFVIANLTRFAPRNLLQSSITGVVSFWLPGKKRNYAT